MRGEDCIAPTCTTGFEPSIPLPVSRETRFSHVSEPHATSSDNAPLLLLWRFVGAVEALLGGRHTAAREHHHGQSDLLNDSHWGLPRLGDPDCAWVGTAGEEGEMLERVLLSLCGKCQTTR